MRIRKSLRLLSVVALSVSIFSCGGGGGGGTSSGGTASLTETEKALASPEVKEVKVGKENLKVVPVSGTVVKDNWAQTSSDVGVIVPTKFGEVEKISNETEGNVTDVLNNENIQQQFFNAQPPYVVVSAKTVKKPIRSFDGKLAVLVDFDSLPMDMTAALANYQSILAIPNNSFNLLKEGYVPYAYYSGDMAFYDANGKRIWDSSIFDGTNLEVYAVIPQDQTSNETFKEGGNYALLHLIPETGEPYVSDEIKVVKKDGKSLTLKAVVDENHLVPFVIAKKSPEDIKSLSGSVSVPYSINLKAGIIYTNKDGKAVGFGKIEGNSYESYYVKPWLNNETTPQAAVVSYILKNGKYELDNFTGGDITIPASAFDPTYVMIDNMTDADKEMLKDFRGNIYDSYSDYFSYYFSSSLNSLLHPEDGCPYYGAEEFCKDFKTVVSAFISNEVGNFTIEEGKVYPYNPVYGSENHTGNCTVTEYSFTNSSLSLSTVCSYQGINEISHKEVALSMIRKSQEEIAVKWSVSFSGKESYPESENVTENYSWKGNANYSYVLILKDGDRSIKSYSGTKTHLKEKSKNGKVYEKETSSSNIGREIVERKPGDFLVHDAVHISESFSSGKTSYSLSYDIDEVAKFEKWFESSGSTLEPKSVVAVVKNVNFTSNPHLPHTIKSSSKLIFVENVDSPGEFYVNMSKEPLEYGECELDELLYSAAYSNSTEGTTVNGTAVAE